MLLSPALLGKRATVRVYPGKRTINGNPRMMRSTLKCTKAMITIKRTASIFMTASSFSGFILKRPPSRGWECGFY
jgi:hypothetical protein